VLPSILPDSFPRSDWSNGCGQPVVATRSGVASEMVLDAETVLFNFPIGDVKKGAEALEQTD